VDWGEQYPTLINVLQTAKEHAQKQGHDIAVKFEGRECLVSGHGTKSGNGKGVYYSWVLTFAGFTFTVAKLSEPFQQTPNVMADIGAVELMEQSNVSTVLQNIKDTISAMGGAVTWDKLSRVDVCADVCGVSMDEFVNLFVMRQYITRGRKWTIYGDERRNTGVSIGAGAVHLRVYDKLFEVVHEKPDFTKFELLQQRWGGCPDYVSRVEFQLRRDFLREHGIDSIADYLEKRSSVVKYLLTEWFRFVDGIPDRENNNQSRLNAHPLWIRVSEVFASWIEDKDAPPLAKVQRQYKDPVKLAKQGFGCLLGAIANLKQGACISGSQFLNSSSEVIDFLLDSMGELDFLKRYESKASRVRVVCA